MTLEELGWSMHFAQAIDLNCFSEGRFGRVAEVQKDLFDILTPAGLIEGELRGGDRDQLLPCVGDWVTFAQPFTNRRGHLGALIEDILPRQTLLARMPAGGSGRLQPMAANVDSIMIVTSPNHDFNLARLDRYLVLAEQAGCEPILVLNKADLVSETASWLAAVRAQHEKLTVCVVSAERRLGLEQLHGFLGVGKTAVLVGSSGVGKTTLLNALCGVHGAVGAIREDDSKGRHTTTARSLHVTLQRGLIIDSPGIREVQVWGGEEALNENFGDLQTFMANCRFRDCRHHVEPGCAVQEALTNGVLPHERWQSYLKLLREQEFQNAKVDARVASERKNRWKKIAKHLQLKKRHGS